MTLRIILTAVFLAGFIYLIWPGPISISEIPSLPNSLKSTDEGDTIQIPNVVAYYSDYRRPFITNFYKDSFDRLTIFGIKIPSIKLNHPPEEAFQYIRDQQQSTYLEQYFYPFRESLFISGYEPFDERGQPFRAEVFPIEVSTKIYASKTNLRLYTSNVGSRVIIYTLIWIWLLLFTRLVKRWSKKA